MALQFRQRAFKQQLAVVDDAHLAHNLLHLAQQMAGNQHRGTAGIWHIVDQCTHFLDASRVKTVGGFIQDQQPGAAQQSHGNAQALFHAKGILPHLALSVCLQVYNFQHAVDVFVGHAFQVGYNFKVFLRSKVQVAGWRLNQTAGLAQQLQPGTLRQCAAQQSHAACRGVNQPQQHFHAGRFTRAIWPNKTIHTPLRNMQVQIVNHGAATIGFAQPFCFNYILHG